MKYKIYNFGVRGEERLQIDIKMPLRQKAVKVLAGSTF